MDPNEEPKGVSTQSTTPVPSVPTVDSLEPPVPNTGITEPENSDQMDTEQAEGESNPLDESHQQFEDSYSPLYSSLSYRSACAQTELDLVPQVYSRQNLEGSIGEPFGPLIMGIRPIAKGADWFIKAIEARFDTTITFELLELKHESSENLSAFEVSFVLDELTSKGIEILRKGTIKIKKDPELCGIFMHPRKSRNWTQGTLTVRIADPQNGFLAPRDVIFEKVRMALDEGLRNALCDHWFSELGWEIKETDKDYGSTGMSPFTAYHHWKQGQRDLKTPMTEHSSHANWSVRESGITTCTHEQGRIKKEFRQHPMQSAIEIRYPIAMTELIKGQLEYSIPTTLKAKLWLTEPIFPKTVLRVMTEGYQNQDDTKRTYLMRLVALPTAQGSEKWSHPLTMIEHLLDKGFNIAAVQTDLTVMEVKGFPLQCVSVSKIMVGRAPTLMSTAFTAAVKQIGGATTAPWQDHVSSFSPKLDTDVYAYDGCLHLIPKFTMERKNIGETIMMAMQEVQARAVEAGLAADPEREQALVEAVSDLRKESLEQETRAVEAQLRKLKAEAANVRATTRTDNHAHKDIPNTFQVCITGSYGEQNRFDVRITKLERHQPNAGINELIDYLMAEGDLPVNLFIPPQEIDALVHSAPCNTTAAPPAINNPGYPVVMSVRLEGDRRDMTARKVQNLRMKELWEDQDVLEISFRLAQNEEEIALAPDWPRAKVPFSTPDLREDPPLTQPPAKRRAESITKPEVPPPHRPPPHGHDDLISEQEEGNPPERVHGRIRPSVGSAHGGHRANWHGYDQGLVTSQQLIEIRTRTIVTRIVTTPLLNSNVSLTKNSIKLVPTYITRGQCDHIGHPPRNGLCFHKPKNRKRLSNGVAQGRNWRRTGGTSPTHRGSDRSLGPPRTSSRLPHHTPMTRTDFRRPKNSNKRHMTAPPENKRGSTVENDLEPIKRSRSPRDPRMSSRLPHRISPNGPAPSRTENGRRWHCAIAPGNERGPTGVACPTRPKRGCALRAHRILSGRPQSLYVTTAGTIKTKNRRTWHKQMAPDDDRWCDGELPPDHHPNGSPPRTRRTSSRSPHQMSVATTGPRGPKNRISWHNGTARWDILGSTGWALPAYPERSHLLKLPRMSSRFPHHTSATVTAPSGPRSSRVRTKRTTLGSERWNSGKEIRRTQ